jgi:hypothetical protein
MAGALARQSQSRVLAVGLERMVSAGLTVATLSIVLSVCNWVSRRSPGGAATKMELALAYGFAALAVLMESCT